MGVFRQFLFAAALVVPSLAQAGEIVVQGRGSVEQAPDMAIISLGARFQAHTAREALTEVNKRTPDSSARQSTDVSMPRKRMPRKRT